MALGCINIVVAANAGGAFSPFGDITTLMVWQKGKLAFWEFFALFLPFAGELAGAGRAHAFRRAAGPSPSRARRRVRLKPGARGVIVLFAATIATAVSFKNFLHLPPALGMMLGLGYLQMWSYFLQSKGQPAQRRRHGAQLPSTRSSASNGTRCCSSSASSSRSAASACSAISRSPREYLYVGLGPTAANIIIGLLSAIVDNIPLMFAVLTMDPHMSHGQWLLITLTCGVGGTMLSIGSAAGVALMGQARGSTRSRATSNGAGRRTRLCASIVVHFW